MGINYHRQKLIQASVSSKKSFDSWFSEVLMYFSIWDSNTYLFNVILFSGDFMFFIERETPNFIPKFREIFSWRETVFRVHRMKFKFMQFFGENGTYCDWQVVFFITKGVWRFFLTARYLALVFTRSFNTVRCCIVQGALCPALAPISIFHTVQCCIRQDALCPTFAPNNAVSKYTVYSAWILDV